MISRKVENSSPVGLTSIPLEPLVENVILFIHQYLPLFPAALVESGTVGETEIEKLLNQQLIDFFNGNSTDFNPYLLYRFIFRKDDENKGTNYKPDIGVTIWNKDRLFAEAQSFFQIECKRLPTPSISSKRSEKEYVIGIEKNTGGIERFKNNKHGSHLLEAAIIGFVQEEALEIWHERITNWLNFEITNTNSIWQEHDHLILEYKNDILHNYISKCTRIKGGTIKLHHFLLNLVNS